MQYLVKFNAAGKRETTLVQGIHYNTEEEQQVYIKDGYTLISDEDYQYYIGNRGMGKNGTGYIRDQKTEKPLSAPPAPHTEPEAKDSPINETRLAIFEAMAAQETRLSEQDTRIAALETKLKGGDSK